MQRTTLSMAFLVCFCGALSLLVKGSSLLFSAYQIDASGFWLLTTVMLSISVGVVKAHFIMSKSCKKNIRRIQLHTNPRPWHFFSGKFLVLLVIMIGAGVIMSHLSQGHFEWLCFVGGVDISIGIALLISSRFYLGAIRFESRRSEF